MRTFKICQSPVGAAVVALVLGLGSACQGGGERRSEEPVVVGPIEDADKKEPEKPPEPVKRTTAELLVGHWLMVLEEPADGKGDFFKQSWRRLYVEAGGSWQAQNFVEQRDDTWGLKGEQLVTGEGGIDLVSVDEERLVLVEDLSQAYLRDGPSRRIRVTYRRLRESEFGPMLGKEVERRVPKAGVYSASYSYRMSKLPTMETTVDRSINGGGRLELAEGGRARGCFGIRVERSSSRSKYASSDGKHHQSEDENRSLLAFEGTWKVEHDQVQVIADKVWRGSCAAETGWQFDVPLEFECTVIAANERLPVETLACRLVQGASQLQDLALNPADTERSGPFTLQSDPSSHITTDRGRPWIFLGAGTGLHLQSEDGRRDRSPQLSFVAPAEEFVEERYVKSPR